MQARKFAESIVSKLGTVDLVVCNHARIYVNYVPGKKWDKISSINYKAYFCVISQLLGR